MTNAPERQSLSVVGEDSVRSCPGQRWSQEGRLLVGTGKHRGSPASQDRRFSWPGSVEYPPVMSGEEQLCQCEWKGVLGCGSVVEF